MFTTEMLSIVDNVILEIESTTRLPFQLSPVRTGPSVIHVTYTVYRRRGGVDRLGDVNNGLAGECAFLDRHRVHLIFTSSSPIVYNIVVRAER